MFVSWAWLANCRSEALTWSGRQQHSWDDRQAGLLSPLVWGGTAAQSPPQTAAAHLRLCCTQLLFSKTNPHRIILQTNKLKSLSYQQWLKVWRVWKNNPFVVLPFPMMTNGVFAAFRTETAFLIASPAAELTGGGGQQGTSLHQRPIYNNI